jgi:hypothetical protein
MGRLGPRVAADRNDPHQFQFVELALSRVSATTALIHNHFSFKDEIFYGDPTAFRR